MPLPSIVVKAACDRCQECHYSPAFFSESVTVSAVISLAVHLATRVLRLLGRRRYRMPLLLIVLLVLVLAAGGGFYGHSRWGMGGGAGVGLGTVLIVILLLYLMGGLHY